MYSSALLEDLVASAAAGRSPAGFWVLLLSETDAVCRVAPG